MCDSCGCGDTQHQTKDAASFSVLQEVLNSNDHDAGHNREHLQRLGIQSFNLMGSPGCGKTTLLERTLERMETKRIAVIEGDLETENDARRIQAKGALAHQIMTGTGCHLDAKLVHKALHHLDLTGITHLFVENVGNLVCPASFDLGTERNIVLLSATEGDDKPLKYPLMFHGADMVVITKAEAADMMEFDIARAKENIHKANPKAEILTLALQGPDQFDRWLEYLAPTASTAKAL